jgi:RecB family endonuclease NucS
MLESEMEDLLWAHPEKFLEPLKPFRRQPRSAVGRADLVFEDALGRLLVIEIKHGNFSVGP